MDFYEGFLKTLIQSQQILDYAGFTENFLISQKLRFQVAMHFIKY